MDGQVWGHRDAAGRLGLVEAADPYGGKIPVVQGIFSEQGMRDLPSRLPSLGTGQGSPAPQQRDGGTPLKRMAGLPRPSGPGQERNPPGEVSPLEMKTRSSQDTSKPVYPHATHLQGSSPPGSACHKAGW
ncbi:hypothetical protein llap_9473 [Limosa lapponica baueri]|uniref:Uncharacterized protein n=1 Tax=Limosa lapponica baueri TaxID=1758121 RepID=A0A2I0U2B9_LIMLA|nr:hypothetical protein llap_9473 [Limosa lapponica baueri]